MSNAAATLPAFAVTATEIPCWIDGVPADVARVTRIYRTKAAAQSWAKRVVSLHGQSEVVIEKIRTAPFESNGLEIARVAV